MQTDLEIVIKDRSIDLRPADVKSFMQMVLQGLDFCHKRWVLHRDVKPNNFLISERGMHACAVMLCSALQHTTIHLIAALQIVRLHR